MIKTLACEAALATHEETIAEKAMRPTKDDK
jgi:hypothetical protein